MKSSLWVFFLSTVTFDALIDALLHLSLIPVSEFLDNGAVIVIKLKVASVGELTGLK